MKIFLAVFILCSNVCTLVSQNISRDTIKIDTINITKNRIVFLSATEKRTSFSKETIEMYQGDDLASFISKMSLANMKTNGGLGANSSLSIRGASSANTSVNWNGISINSLTTGAADLSLINTGSFSNVDITYGASGSIHGSGTYGGAVDLYNKADWEKHSRIGIGSQLSSFGNQKHNIYAKISNKKVSYNAQAFYNYGKNNFTYTDYYDFGNPRETAKHNQNKSVGIIQDVHLNINKHFVSMGLWYQFKKKNIAGTMGVGKPVSNQVQRDSSLRVFASWKHLFNKVQIQYKTAWIYDYLLYTDKKSANQKTYDIYSEIITTRLLNEINARYYVSNKLSIDVKADYKNTKANVAAYSKTIYETDKSMAISSKYTPTYGMFIFSVYKTWNKINNTPLMYSLSSKLNIVDKIIHTRLKYSTNYRRPTLNERYWIPGGNINLKPESGRVFEIALIINNIEKIKNFSLDLNYFNAQNKNSIRWMPGEASFWSPINTGGTYNHGVEAEADYRFKIKDVKTNINAKYAYNDSFYNNKQASNYKQQLAYTSTHTLRIHNNISYKNIALGALLSYRSRTITTKNNYLDSNYLLNLYSSYKLILHNSELKLNFRIDNVLNKSYQLARAYPMPGRYFNIGVNLTFKK